MSNTTRSDFRIIKAVAMTLLFCGTKSNIPGRPAARHGAGYVTPNTHALRIQVCPKKGITPTVLFEGWDLDHQSYSREGVLILRDVRCATISIRINFGTKEQRSTSHKELTQKQIPDHQGQETVRPCNARL